MKAFNRQLMAKLLRVMTAMYNVTYLRLSIIFSRLSVKRPRQQNYRILLLLTINTRKMVTREKIGIGKLQLREILSPGRERGIWASNAGASRVIREVSHVCKSYHHPIIFNTLRGAWSDFHGPRGLLQLG